MCSILPDPNDKISRIGPAHRLQVEERKAMTTRHAEIDSPLGELTLVADGDALTGVYFRHHWYRPSADTFGPRADAQIRRSVRERAHPVDRLPGRPPDGTSTCRSSCTAMKRSAASGTC